VVFDKDTAATPVEQVAAAAERLEEWAALLSQAVWVFRVEGRQFAARATDLPTDPPTVRPEAAVRPARVGRVFHSSGADTAQ